MLGPSSSHLRGMMAAACDTNGRSMDNEVVRVARTLRRQGPAGEPVWSVRVRRDGRWLVDRYVTSLTLTDVHMKVLPGGRAAALRSGQRNVHAFIVGVAGNGGVPDCAVRSTYDLWHAGAFVRSDTGATVWAADGAVCCPSGLWLSNPS